jgi:tripartite ATP-independent transporter DctM subunit
MWILVTLVFVLLSIGGVPIAFVLGISSLVILLITDAAPLYLLPQRMFTGIDSFPIMAVPFFVTAGHMMNSLGLTDKLIKLAMVLVGHIRGGLAHVNIVASMFFAGISGSAVADTSGLGSILIPSMVRRGYSPEFSAAITASSSVMGPIIPPSITAVVFASLTGASVAGVFLAGAVPGILIGLVLMLVAYVISKRRNYPCERTFPPFREFWEAFVEAIPALVMPVIILGGILGGIFTPTEAGAIAVGYAFVFGLVRGRLKIRRLWHVLLESSMMTCTILLIMSTANTFNWLVAIQGIPRLIADTIGATLVSPVGILILINITFLIVGCFLEGLSAMVILVPILMPTVLRFGINELLLGCLVVVNINIGLLTPPMALCLYIASKIARVPPERVFIDVLPFLFVEIAILILITYIPHLSLALPHFFGYK